MNLTIVTKHYGTIDVEMIKIKDTILYYKLNSTDTRWLNVPEGDVKYIGIRGHLRKYVS